RPTTRHRRRVHAPNARPASAGHRGRGDRQECFTQSVVLRPHRRPGRWQGLHRPHAPRGRQRPPRGSVFAHLVDVAAARARGDSHISPHRSLHLARSHLRSVAPHSLMKPVPLLLAVSLTANTAFLVSALRDSPAPHTNSLPVEATVAL